MVNDKDDHPYGTSLVMRDTKANRQLFPKQTEFGYVSVAETECPTASECPHYHYKEDGLPENANTPIHILIASFRDRLCGRTLHNAFRRAKDPTRIFIRVIDQTQQSDLEDDLGCWKMYCEKYNTNCLDYENQVQIVPVDASLSKGPTYARSKLSAMIHYDYIHNTHDDLLDFHPVQKQDFCMQIDSHMDFHDDWDVSMIEMFHRTENDYAVLSTYVADIKQNNKDPKNVPNLCMVEFTGSIRNWGTKECRDLIKPKLTNAMWGAGLSFHRCHAELAVPVDPYLDNVFDGEEGSRGIRFFTHGYDVYTPDTVMVTHDYHNHQGNPVVHTWGRHGTKDEKGNVAKHDWKWNKEIESARSNWHTFGSKRVNMLLGVGSAFDSTKLVKEERDRIRKSRYGLGTKRTLDQVIEFTGISLLERKMIDNKCGNLLWIPYKESPNYGIVEEVLARTNDGYDTPKQQQLRAIVKPSPVMMGNSTTSLSTSDKMIVFFVVALALLFIKVLMKLGWKEKDDKLKQ